MIEGLEVSMIQRVRVQAEMVGQHISHSTSRNIVKYDRNRCSICKHFEMLKHATLLWFIVIRNNT